MVASFSCTVLDQFYIYPMHHISTGYKYNNINIPMSNQRSNFKTLLDKNMRDREHSSSQDHSNHS